MDSFTEEKEKTYIKFAGRVYEVLATKVSCDVTWYMIEDEPGHFDWVHNVEIVKSKYNYDKERFKAV